MKAGSARPVGSAAAGSPRGCGRAAGATSATNRYLFGAVCPVRDTGVALVLPVADTAAMQLMLDELANTVTPGALVLVILDRAGWHTSRSLRGPANLTLVFLPPYSPELNAIERVWLYLKERFLSHRLWTTMTTSFVPAARPGTPCAWNPAEIQSLCSFPWLPQVKN